MKVVEGLVTGEPAKSIFASVFQGLTMRFPQCVACIWTADIKLNVVAMSLLAHINVPQFLRDEFSKLSESGDAESLSVTLKTLRTKIEAAFYECGLHNTSTRPLFNRQNRLLGIAAVGFEQAVTLSEVEQKMIEQYIRVGGLAIEREQLEKENHFLTFYDYLTEIPNRRFFHTQLSQDLQHAVESSEPLSLAMVDLDNFKYINDTFGHDVGDKLLLMISKRIVKSLRDSDTVARIGGDEFSMILPRMDGESALAHLRTLLQEVNKPAEIEGWRFPVSASIGVACYPNHGTDKETLLKRADMALYEAKQSEKLRINVF
ncbi:GGDEF domain-containing protein [Alicyclobacillus sp. SO9]|nr:GGDEF domain-containing protein [Alicyclobacillus sp. SO9]